MKLDGFEINKIAAAGLLALLIGMISSKISDYLVSPQILAKNSYIVEGVEDTSNPGVAAKRGPEPIEPLLASANVERGKEAAKKCLQCHVFDKGGSNKIGPQLYAVVGRQVAKVAGFSYSSAMSAVQGEWNFQNLNEYLYKPAAYVKGTKMSFAGITNGQERADVIAYLNSLSDSPKPLPTAAKEEPKKEEVKGTSSDPAKPDSKEEQKDKPKEASKEPDTTAK